MEIKEGMRFLNKTGDFGITIERVSVRMERGGYVPKVTICVRNDQGYQWDIAFSSLCNRINDGWWKPA